MLGSTAWSSFPAIRMEGVITFSPNQDGELGLNASICGFPVFLDQFAIKELACRNPSRRQKFIEVVHRGADVLFSVSNAAELTGPQGDSFREIRDFLDEIGPHWFPVELNPVEIVNREREGKPVDACCVCKDFMIRLLAFHNRNHPKERVFGISSDLFNLRFVMDWLVSQRHSIASGKKEMDAALIKKIEDHRAKHDADPQWLDNHFPALQFHPQFAGTFAYVNMVRCLVLESKSYAMQPGDGIDFCQAVIGSAFASVATLDKKWKRRVEIMPKPNQLATVYYAPELDRMVDDLESAVKQWLQVGPGTFLAHP